VEDVQDEPLAAERVAGIDIGKAMVMATIRVPGTAAGGRRRQETREFGTTRRELLALAAWLGEWEVERAGMEATSDYWKPVLFTLEREGIECLLYQASRVKAMPGRPKTDRHDSIWLAKLTEQGAVQGSFIPPEDVRVLRAHTRYRRHLIQARTAEKQRTEKLLEDAHLKLSSVLSDIHGKSGRDMLEAIIAGERDPEALAQLARNRVCQIFCARDFRCPVPDAYPVPFLRAI
jgi:transposase